MAYKPDPLIWHPKIVRPRVQFPPGPLQTNISFQNKAGQILDGVLRYSDMEGKMPAVLVLHGFNENKERAWIRDIANHLTPYGFVTFRFDFHGHGESEGDFEKHTVTQQIEDVESAVSFLETVPQIDVTRIAVVGHDIGGDIALLAAEKDARIKTVIVWGARGNIEKHIKSKLADYELRELKTKGFYAHGQFDIHKGYIDSLQEHDVAETLKHLFIPLLVIHGTADLQVRIEEARQLFLRMNEPKHLEIIDDADHWFRGESRKQLLETILNWLKRWL